MGRGGIGQLRKEGNTWRDPTRQEETQTRSSGKEETNQTQEDPLTARQPNIKPPKIGNLVTSTTYEMGHPDYAFCRISKVYVFFSIVVTGPWNWSSNYINVEWSFVEDGHMLIKSEKEDVKFEGHAREIHLILVLKHKAQVVALRNNPHLDGVNRFLKEALLNEFYFIEPTE